MGEHHKYALTSLVNGIKPSRNQYNQHLFWLPQSFTLNQQQKPSGAAVKLKS